MNDWRYDEGEVMFYHEGVPTSYFNVVDALNAAEARIAELEYNAANNAMSIHAILSALDINDETRGVSDDMYDDALGLAFKLTTRINELENRIKERDVTIHVLMQVIEHLESQLPKEKENEHTEQ